MLAFIEEFGFEAGLFCVIGESVEIHIKPIERFTQYVLVLHLIVDLTIIIVSKIDHHAAVLLFI